MLSCLSYTDNFAQCATGAKNFIMEQGQLNWIANFIWGIADDVLRDLYVRGTRAYCHDRERRPGYFMSPMIREVQQRLVDNAMWIFNKDGFFSAVEHRDDPDQLMVRARCREDIERLAKSLGAEVVHTPNADYAYRITVSKAAFADYMRDAVMDLDYSNFKDACAGHGTRSRAYMDVWSAMRRLQED